jgi:hypothetical protein
MRFNHSTMTYMHSGDPTAESDSNQEDGRGGTEQIPEKAVVPSSQTGWRDDIDDPKLREHAARFATPGDLTKAHLDLRGKLSNAIIKPGRGASAEDVAAYRRALGVPDSPAGYRFDLVDEKSADTNDIAFRDSVAEAFHRADLTVEQGRQLTAWWTGVQAELQERQVAADRAYAEQSSAELRADWGQEADANYIHAGRAAERLFDEHFEAIRKLETRDGHYLLDHPHMLRALARLGKEMAEGDLGGPINTDERDTLAEQRDAARAKRNAALQAGNHAEARQWDAREREIIAKMSG